MNIKELSKELQDIFNCKAGGAIVFKIGKSWECSFIDNGFLKDMDYLESNEYRNIYEIYDKKCLPIIGNNIPEGYFTINKISKLIVKEYDKKRVYFAPVDIIKKYKDWFPVFKNVSVYLHEETDKLDQSILFYASKDIGDWYELPACLFTGILIISKCEYVYLYSDNIIEVVYYKGHDFFKVVDGVFKKCTEEVNFENKE